MTTLQSDSALVEPIAALEGDSQFPSAPTRWDQFSWDVGFWDTNPNGSATILAPARIEADSALVILTASLEADSALSVPRVALIANGSLGPGGRPSTSFLAPAASAFARAGSASLTISYSCRWDRFNWDAGYWDYGPQVFLAAAAASAKATAGPATLVFVLKAPAASAKATAGAATLGFHFFRIAPARAISSPHLAVLSAPYILSKPVHPVGLYVPGEDRAGDGQGGRLVHTLGAVGVSYSVQANATGAVGVSYLIQLAGSRGVGISYQVQPASMQFSVNGVPFPAPHHMKYVLPQVMGYDLSGNPIRQGYTTVVFVYDELQDSFIQQIMAAYNPASPQVTVIYLNELGNWVAKRAMMAPPQLGTRQTVVHQNVQFTFSHIAPD